MPQLSVIVNNKIESLIRLALCPSAAKGEWQNAACFLVSELRKSMITAESFLDCIQGEYEPMYSRDWPIITFGKYKGSSIDDIPASYLQWVLGNCHNITLRLKKEIELCLKWKATCQL